MIDFITNFSNILLVVGECSILGEDLAKNLKYIYTAIEISVPVLVILLCTVDLVKAVMAQDENDMKKAQSRAIKRVIIGLAIFFVPITLDVLLDIAGIATGTCELGGSSKTLSKPSGSAPTFSSATTVSYSEIKLNYSPTQKASGVQIFNITSGKYKNTKNLKTATMKNLKDDTKYEFKVRSYYNNSNGKTTYSNWSKVLSAKTKKKPVEKISTNTSSSKTSAKINIFIGDSRTVGMKKAGLITSSNTVAKSGKGYKWFVNTAISNVDAKMKNNKSYNIISWLGINGIKKYGAEKYYKKYKELAKGKWKNQTIYVVSVGTVKKGIDHNSSPEAVTKFNNKMKELINNSNISNLKYIELSFNEKPEHDGLHYTKSQYKKIYNEIISQIDK